MASTWGGNGRVREVGAVAEESRHLWLAGQIDEVEHAIASQLEQLRKNELDSIRADVHAMRQGQARLLWSVVGLLISITTLSMTLLITGAVGK